MSLKKVGPDAFYPILKDLDGSGAVYFLEGGQAVNIWARFIQTQFGEISDLLRYDPFTSKDCDVFVSMDALRFFENAEGTLHKSKSPADGQLGIYVLPEDESLHVDLMTSVYGIPMAQIPRAIKRAQLVEGLCVLDPIYLFKAKCHNLADELSAGNLTERQVIKELKFLVEICTKDRVVKQILQQREISLKKLIPANSLMSDRAPILSKFLQTLK